MVNRKTVWHISSNPFNSAITEYALSSIRSLERRGYDNIFSPLKGSPAEMRSRLYGLRCLPLKNFHISSLLSFCSLGSRLSPTYIITYGGPETFLSKMLRRRTKKLIRFRGQGVTNTNKKYKSLLRYSYSHLDSVIVPGLRLHQSLSRIDCHDNITCVPLGLDTDFFSPAGTWKGPISQNKRPEILIFGRIDPVKGHSFFIEVFEELLGLWDATSSAPRPYLHIVGKEVNTSIESLQEQVRKSKNLKLGEDIVFTPEIVQDPKAYLSRACLGVVCSLASEEICRVGQEFLVCGTPIFVSGVGSLDDCLFSPEVGRSYKELSREKLIRSLQELIFISQNESIQDRMSRSARAKDLFSFDRMGASLESLIQSPPRGFKGLEL